MKQISVLIENKSGRLATVAQLLAKNGINLRALSIADTPDYGILRMIADDAEKARKVLDDNGYLSKIHEVIGVKIEDKPGSLAKIITALSKGEISVEYTYAFTSAEPGTAFMVFRVDDNAKAVAALKAANIGATL